VHTWGEAEYDAVLHPLVLAHAIRGREADPGNQMPFMLEFQVEIKVIKITRE